MNFTQYKYYYQSQAIALPADPRDPFLTHWVKPRDSNPLPMAPPPGGLRAQFRDPISPWLVPTNQIGADLAAWLGWQNAGFAAGGAPAAAAGGGGGGGGEETEARGVGAGAGGVWFTAVGALDDCVGSAALYSSPDLTSWTYAGACKRQQHMLETVMQLPYAGTRVNVCLYCTTTFPAGNNAGMQGVWLCCCVACWSTVTQCLPRHTWPVAFCTALAPQCTLPRQQTALHLPVVRSPGAPPPHPQAPCSRSWARTTPCTASA